jgi:hypothetical protein
MNKFLSALGVFIAVVVLIPISGLVVQILWGWFIVPVFAVKALTIAQAIGLSIVTHFLTYQSVHVEDTKTTSHKIFVTYMRHAMVLLVGYITTLFL